MTVKFSGVLPNSMRNLRILQGSSNLILKLRPQGKFVVRTHCDSLKLFTSILKMENAIQNHAHTVIKQEWSTGYLCSCPIPATRKFPEFENFKLLTKPTWERNTPRDINFRFEATQILFTDITKLWLVQKPSFDMLTWQTVSISPPSKVCKWATSTPELWKVWDVLKRLCIFQAGIRSWSLYHSPTAILFYTHDFQDVPTFSPPFCSLSQYFTIPYGQPTSFLYSSKHGNCFKWFLNSFEFWASSSPSEASVPEHYQKKGNTVLETLKRSFCYT